MRILIFIFLAFSIKLQAQNLVPVRSRSIFKLSPQHLMNNNVKLGIERFNSGYSQSLVVYLTGTWYTKEENNSNNDHKGLGAELQYRKYIRPLKIYSSKKGRNYQRGIYTMVCAQALYHSQSMKSISYLPDPSTGEIIASTYYDYQVNTSNTAFTIALGIQQVWWNVILIDAFFGGGAQFSDPKYSGMLNHDWSEPRGITEVTYQGFLPKIGIHIGIGL